MTPQSKLQAPSHPLTPSEVRIVRLICDGLQAREIAAKLGVSVRTVEAHKENIFKKVGVHNSILLFRWALRNGVVVL